MIRRTKQVGLWSDRSPYDIYIPQNQPAPKEGIGIDPGLTVVTTNGTSSLQGGLLSSNYSKIQFIPVAWITKITKNSQF